MKLRLLISIVVALSVVGGGAWFLTQQGSQTENKLYVAEEGDGSVAVIDPATKRVLRRISLSVEHEGGEMVYAPHNVQVSPDNLSVWVTANVAGHEGHSSQIISSAKAHGEEENTGEADEIIVINPKKDLILKRIPVMPGAHLAHVVVSRDGALAYVTGQKSDAIYQGNSPTHHT